MQGILLRKIRNTSCCKKWWAYWDFTFNQYRSSHPEVFLGKGVLKICGKFTGEHPCRIVISIKLLCNFIEIELQHGCSPINLLPILRTPFPKNTFGGLLLQTEGYSLERIRLPSFVKLQLFTHFWRFLVFCVMITRSTFLERKKYFLKWEIIINESKCTFHLSLSVWLSSCHFVCCTLWNSVISFLPTFRKLLDLKCHENKKYHLELKESLLIVRDRS